MSEQDEVNEQARLNGMGAERELALMAKLEAATRARQQAQEALYAERDRHAATVKKMQADLEMRTDESVRYRGVLDATVIVIEEMRQEIEGLQAGSGEVVAWQASDGGHSFISHRTHTTNPDYRAVYTIPLCVATPQPEPAPVAATSAMVPLTDDAWLEYLLKHADLSTLDLAAFRGESIQSRGLWVLRVQSNDLRKLVERAHGIGLTVGDTE